MYYDKYGNAHRNRYIKVMDGVEDLKTHEKYDMDTIIEELNGYEVQLNETKRINTLVCQFMRSKGFTLDDYNDWLVKEVWGWD